MEEDEDYDSDSTVLITDFSKNPEKIARKRRKLDATFHRISQTNIHVNDAENRAPVVPRGAGPRGGSRNHNNDAEQWRIAKFLGDCEPDSNNLNNNSEDLKIKHELLKQEHNSNCRIGDDEGNGDKGRGECVVISDDSDDDCTVVNHEEKHVSENINVNPRISVLTPSAINTRRATLDSFEINEPVSNNDPVTSTNPSKVDSKLKVLKPSAINARRATFNCFEENINTVKIFDKIKKKDVDFSSNETKNKVNNDNKINKNVIETNELYGDKTMSEPLPKLTMPDQNEVSRKRNISGVIQGKPGDLQIRRIFSSSKDMDNNAGVIKIVKRDQSTSSNSVLHSKADVLATNVQEMSGIQETVDTDVVNNNGSSKSNEGCETNAKMKTVNFVFKHVTGPDKNNASSNVNNSKETTNYVKEQTIHSVKRPVDIDLSDRNKKENENSYNNKATDAKQVTVDKKTLVNNASCSTVFNNTNSVESLLKQDIMSNKIVQHKENRGVLDESAQGNEQFSKVSKTDESQGDGTATHIGNNYALCCNEVTENPVIEILKNMMKGNPVQQTETTEKQKSNEKLNEFNNESSSPTVSCDREINSNKIDETDNRKDILHTIDRHVAEFHVNLFNDVNQYLKNIFRDSKKLKLLRAPPDELKREVKRIIHGAKKHDASEIRYACPKCSQVSAYSPKAMYQIGNDNNPLKNNTLKCKLCRGLQILHITNVQFYSKLENDRNYDGINAAPQRKQDSISNQPSGENNNNISTRDSNASTSALIATARVSVNDVATKPNQNENKERISTSIEKPRQSDSVIHNEKNIANSGDKTKSHKRKTDDNRFPADPKRIRTDTDTQGKKAKATDSFLNNVTEKGNSANVGSNKTTLERINQNVTNADILQTSTSSGGKQFECKICKKVLYTICMAKKHRKEAHGHLDLKNKKLYNVTEIKQAPTSSDIQSSASVENTTSEDNQTSEPEKDNTNQESGSVGSSEVNRLKDNKENKTKEVASQKRDEIKNSNNYENNCDDRSDQINVPHDENSDEKAKTNQEKKRKASQDGNVVQEVKQANVKKCSEKTMYKCLICKELFTDYGSRMHREDKHPDFINKHLFDKVTVTGALKIDKSNNSDDASGEKSKTNKDDQFEINLINDFLGELENEDKSSNVNNSTKSEKVSKPLNTFDVVDNNVDVDVIRTNTEIISVSDILNKINDTNTGNTEDKDTKISCGDSSSKNVDSVDETIKLPVTNISQSVNDKLNTEVEDIIVDQRKPKRTFPTASKRPSWPSLANCYNCRTNLDINDINNHDCTTKYSTLYNCFSCGANIRRDDTHECDKERVFDVEDIQITKIETVKEVNVFKCEDCNTATDIYDEVIRHCQNHYNNTKDSVKFCKTCQLFYNSCYFETHKHLHENEIKITNYSYKSLFSNWDRVLDNIPTDIVRGMQKQSIYKSHCVKMKVKEEGPWEYSLYQCNQCETCVPPTKLVQHCLDSKQCYSVAYICSECEKIFLSAPTRNNHELDHRSTEKFKIIEFNCKKDERFNFKLLKAFKLEMESRRPIADLYQCHCGIHFTSDEIFRKHFVICNLESDKGVNCHRCDVARLFEASELENHLSLHHSSVTYRFRVNRLVIHQEVEPLDFFNHENDGKGKVESLPHSTEDDIKLELLKQENGDRAEANSDDTST